jgi:hypothetical protein
MSADPKRKLLIVVHPGSACGSADFNVGRHAAELARNELAAELDAWNGDVLVIDGELSDELDAQPWKTLGRSVRNLVERATENGFSARRVDADPTDDPDQAEIAVRMLPALGITDDDAIVVTGCWTYDDGGGCVDSVIDALRKNGKRAELGAGAVREI